MTAYPFEHHRLEGTTADALTALHLPEAVCSAWARFTAPLQRSVVIARDGGRVVGAVLCVRRTLGEYVKLAAAWTAAADTTLESELLAEAERAAWADGAVVVKHESTATANGYLPVPIPPMPAPIPDVLPQVPGASFRWREPRQATTVPYVRQTSDFTCGAASLLMALGYFGLVDVLDRETEFALWREATIVEACDPYGLALTASGHGLDVALTVTTDAFMLLEEFDDERAKDVRRFLQSQFRRNVTAAGIPVAVRGFSADDVRAVLDSGQLAIVLIDEDPFEQGSCPHWIVVHGTAGDAFLIHDPWTQMTAGETWVDAYDLPVLPDGLERLCAFGDPPYSALVAVGPATS